jgi:hypothetical protein
MVLSDPLRMLPTGASFLKASSAAVKRKALNDGNDTHHGWHSRVLFLIDRQPSPLLEACAIHTAFFYPSA